LALNAVDQQSTTDATPSDGPADAAIGANITIATNIGPKRCIDASSARSPVYNDG
jgi:hypothetical protein